MTFETLSNVQTIAEGSDEEFESGRLQADAASAAGVKVVLFSTLEDSNSLTQVLHGESTLMHACLLRLQHHLG